MELFDDWETFLSRKPLKKCAVTAEGEAPDPGFIYISTRTYIMYMSKNDLDLWELFWGLPILPYDTAAEGITEKQLKLQSTKASEVAEINERLKACAYSSTHVIQHVETEAVYKDIRKITVGLSKKSLRTKRPKGAFYNCVATNVRIRCEAGFREFHVKVFNTGKIEITGIQMEEHLRDVIQVLTANLRQVMFIEAVPQSEMIILINSNFNCNFFIHRDKLFELLRTRYDIPAIYDPCTYPGIQCKLFVAEGAVVAQPVEGAETVSVMIFRTGSILIVGKCAEDTLNLVYAYLNRLFKEEYRAIVDPNCVQAVKKAVKVKRFRKVIQLGVKEEIE
jgi:TATA-box binding protein (TBP) (component of TFIID and TFIIIB)